MKKKTHF